MMFSDLTPTQQDVINTMMSLTFESRLQILHYVMDHSKESISIGVSDKIQVGEKIG